jgi:hypothetical protein
MKSKIRGIHGTFTLALTFTPYLDSSQTNASRGNLAKWRPDSYA